MHLNNQYILSPCGTSLLTNQCEDQNERKLVYIHANKKEAADIKKVDRERLEELIGKVSKNIESANNQEAARMSAELNGIVQLYNGKALPDNDFHFLLSTDTWLGYETAKLVEKWLRTRNHKLATLVHRQRDLRTDDLSSFQLSLTELITKFDEELSAYKKKGHKIVFNLTGGFKSIQGFLQSIANFYADEVVYIFETSSALMRIPRLPVRLDLDRVIEENLAVFRNLFHGLPVFKAEKMPEIFLFTMDSETMLSPWGKLVFSKSKKEIYRKRLLPSPSPEKIQYAALFERDVKTLPPDRVELVNHRIDQLNKYLDNHAINPPSLDFKQLKGKAMKVSTHEIDAWSDLDAKRIFGHFEKDGSFVLDKLDKGLH
ncbi:MAG: putative CRISPR-associated protein [Nitrospinota bacterium]